MEQFKLNLQIIDKRFEDSLELLIELIKVNKVNIFDIPISEITRQYISYVEYYKEIDPEYASEFLVLAATLMYIKSQMLLPTESALLEDLDDPREEIVKQLIEYQKYKQASETLETYEEAYTFERNENPILIEMRGEEQWSEVTFEELLKAFAKVANAPKPEQFLENMKLNFSVDSKMQDIRNALEKDKSLSFFNFFSQYGRIEIIFSFIALLELAKRQEICLKQSKTFDDIFIFKKDEHYQIEKDKEIEDFENAHEQEENS